MIGLTYTRPVSKTFLEATDGGVLVEHLFSCRNPRTRASTACPGKVYLVGPGRAIPGS